MEITSPARTISYEPLDAIAGTDGNPKSHDLPGLIRAIALLGWTAPAVLDERTDQLVIGHGRLEAARAIRAYVAGEPVLDRYAEVFDEPRVRKALAGPDGKPQPPEGVHVDDAGTWHVPVVRGWASRDDDHARAAIVADNKLTEAGGWDDRPLAEWLDRILDADPGLLEVTGFTSNDLDLLLLDLGQFADRTAAMFANPVAQSAASTAPQTGDEPDTEPAEIDTGAGTAGPTGDFTQVSWVISTDQAKTVRAALARARKVFDLSTSNLALCAIAQHFLAAHPDEEKTPA